MNNVNTKRSQFLNGYSGKNLLQKHSLNEEGLWRVRGEDPNCDMGGSHVMPELGNFQGKLTDIIDMAVQMHQFWAWGGGGDITKINVRTITHEDIVNQEALKARRDQLKRELDEIEGKIIK